MTSPLILNRFIDIIDQSEAALVEGEIISHVSSSHRCAFLKQLNSNIKLDHLQTKKF